MFKTRSYFKLGDKVRFVGSSKRLKFNINQYCFTSLDIPNYLFRQEGTVTGFFRPYPILGKIGQDKTKPIVRFDGIFSELSLSLRYVIPESILKISEIEPNHPLTHVFI